MRLGWCLVAKNNWLLRIGFLIGFQQEYGEDGIGFLYLPDVINPFVAEIIYNTGKAFINFHSDSFKAIEVFFPQLKTADTIYCSDVMSCSALLVLLSWVPTKPISSNALYRFLSFIEAIIVVRIYWFFCRISRNTHSVLEYQLST